MWIFACVLFKNLNTFAPKEPIMQNIEPFERWRKLYKSEEDSRSPFFGRQYNDTLCTNTIYNYYIHPQWDAFGSDTLYTKLLFADYKAGFAVLEFLGEWNDCLYNDIMFLKRDVIEPLMNEGIRHFVLIGENVLAFHASDDAYYEEWFDDVEDGWIVGIGFRDHVLAEFEMQRIDYYIALGEPFTNLPWRRFTPQKLFALVNDLVMKRLMP